ADHFLGLTKIHDSEELEDPRKRLFLHPRRIYHNGLVKRPSKKNGKARRDEEMLGATREVDGDLFITGLENDILKVADSEMNEPFLKWKKALQHWKKRGPIAIRRLEIGDHDAFDFLREEDIDVQVLGPIPAQVKGQSALRFLGNPPKGPRIGHESLSLDEKGFSGKSASHTINGHSVIFRLTYGQFNLLFTGDLNDESGRALARAHNRGVINLRAEVFKTPHHGSADFSGAFIQAVSPVISVISSGDESAKKEYVHPRATIMGTLGKYSRVEEPLIFCTELVAFFSLVGTIERDVKPKKGEDPMSNRFTAFERSSFGIVKIRTDGERLLVYTNSGKKDMWEAYAYTIDDYGKPSPAPVRM
ncbi:MAG TPA: competence protein, partial [Thermoanaerobaculia bacterium]|nr:competence protein [Thermoanaerobaculia bacterium]